MELVGNFGVDAGLGWIGDPQNFLSDKPKNFDEWSNFCDELFQREDELGQAFTWTDNKLGDIGFISSSGYGDGFYPVYAERDEKGEIKSFLVDFIPEEDEDEYDDGNYTVTYAGMMGLAPEVEEFSSPEPAGKILVSSGYLWIGDPCYIVTEDSGERMRGNVRWDEFDEFYERYETMPNCNSAVLPYNLGHEGLGVCLRVPTGEWNVSVVYNSDGRVARLRVER